MDFDVIGGSGIDTARVRGHLVGSRGGAPRCGGGIAVAVTVSAHETPPPAEEDIIDVKLASSEEEKAPEPPPPPPPEPASAPAPRGRAQLTAPKEVPTSRSEERRVGTEHTPASVAD